MFIHVAETCQARFNVHAMPYLKERIHANICNKLLIIVYCLQYAVFHTSKSWQKQWKNLRNLSITAGDIICME